MYRIQRSGIKGDRERIGIRRRPRGDLDWRAYASSILVYPDGHTILLLGSPFLFRPRVPSGF